MKKIDLLTLTFIDISIFYKDVSLENFWISMHSAMANLTCWKQNVLVITCS